MFEQEDIQRLRERIQQTFQTFSEGLAAYTEKLIGECEDEDD